MTVDRDQTRRWSDLDLQIADDPRHLCYQTMRQLIAAEARLAEVESRLALVRSQKNEAKARLAKVPALVEAATEVQGYATAYRNNADAAPEFDWALQLLRDALADWEQG
jgi:hypothetical protein